LRSNLTPSIASLFDAAPIGLAVAGPDLRWARVNPAFAELNQLPVDEVVGRRPSELDGELGGRVEELMEAVLRDGEPRAAPTEGALGADPGTLRQWEVHYFPVEGGVGVSAVEVTERRRAETALAVARRRDALLARAGQLLSTALSVQETAELVAQLAVPEVADWAFVELLEPDGSIRRAAMRHRDPERMPWLREMDARYPVHPDAPEGSAKVIRTGRAEVLPEIPDEMLVAVAQDPEHLAILRGVGFRSAVIAPLLARGRVLGCLALATTEPGRAFGEHELALTTALADRAALALDNALAFTQRDLVAVHLQEQLLPRELPTIPGLDVAARYSAAGEGNDVGGDFYDLFAAGEGWMAVIGDVVGKGPAAAAVTGLARHTLRAAAAYETAPSALLRVLNGALLAEDPGRRLASVACLHLRPADGSLAGTVSCAGHPLPFLLRGDGSVEGVGQFGSLLGVTGEPELRDVELVMRPGDTLLLYTDGVIEARGPGGLLGEERLAALLGAAVGDAPARVVERVDAAVLAASGGRPRDDVAIVALRLRPGPARATAPAR